MLEVTADPKLVACCGLYCGACGAHRKGKCPGCRKNKKATWCKVRSCCLERGYASCAECADFPDPMKCEKFNNFFSKVFGLLFRSDRAACVRQIRSLGLEGHAKDMAEKKRVSIKRGKNRN